MAEEQGKKGTALGACAPYRSMFMSTREQDILLPKMSKKGKLELDLQWADIREFPTEILNYNELKVLKINTRHIPKLPRTITRLTQLEELYLERSYFGDVGLEEIPTFLSELSNLRVLSVRRNIRVSSFVDEFIASLPSRLEHLDMSHCDIKQLLSCAQHNKLQLKTLDLSGNSLTLLIFSRWLHVTEMKILNLSVCQLEKIPEALKELRNLQELNLDNNSTLQDFSTLACEGLSNLKVLRMTSCDLHHVPAGVSALTKLETLILSENHNLISLSMLPCASLKELKLLEVSDCDLLEILTDLSQLESLEYLDLSYNTKLQFLPAAACEGLNKLKRLNLRGCAIRQLPVKLREMKDLMIHRDLKITFVNHFPTQHQEDNKIPTNISLHQQTESEASNTSVIAYPTSQSSQHSVPIPTTLASSQRTTPTQIYYSTRKPRAALVQSESEELVQHLMVQMEEIQQKSEETIAQMRHQHQSELDTIMTRIQSMEAEKQQMNHQIEKLREALNNEQRKTERLQHLLTEEQREECHNKQTAQEEETQLH